MHRIWTLFLSLTATALIVAGCSSSSTSNTPAAGSSGTKPSVKVGSTNFNEQEILAEAYAQVLEANGYKIERKFKLGSREIVAPALEKGDIDFVVEYLATYEAFLMKDKTKATSDVPATQKALQDALTPKNLTVLDASAAVDTNGFVVTKATADKYKLKKLSDLTAQNGNLVLGGPPECPQRPFCQQGLDKTYGLKFKDFKALDAGGPLTVAALDGGQIDVGLLFTTDATIQVKGYVLLEDDKHLQLADNIAPVVRNDLLSKAPSDFKTLVNGVTAKLTTDEVTGLVKQANVDKKDPKDIATAWLKSKGLIK